ncbi:ABC transporter ATP-binding protein [Dermabacteraceae bacterium P9123]
MVDSAHYDPKMSATLLRLASLFDRSGKIQLGLIVTASVCLALLETVAIVLILPLVDLIVGKNNLPGFINDFALRIGLDTPSKLGLTLVFVVVGIFILKDIAAIYFAWWQAGFLAKQRVATQVSMMEGFMCLPWMEYRKRSTAEMIRSVNEAVIQVYDRAVGGFIAVVSTSFTLFAIAAALVFTIPIPTITVLAYFSLGSFLYMSFVRPRSLAAGEAIMESTKNAHFYSLAALRAYKEITLRHSEAYFANKYRDAALRGVEAGRIANFYSNIPRYFLEILFISAMGILLVYMFGTGKQGEAVGAIALLIAAGFRLLPNVGALITAVNSIRVGSHSLGLVIKERTNYRGKLPKQHGDLRRLTFDKEIKLESVSFAYEDGEEMILEEVSLSIPHGSSVAFVGGSGAGKTTLVDLLLGLLQPTSGRILVDGKNISEQCREWQENISMVPQEVYMSGGTLKDNVLFDSVGMDGKKDHLLETLERANLSDLVAKLPDGIETLCGEGGARLSGGQRQRVGIARALYKEPSLLVLDEATSALDNETEKKITDTIDSLSGNVTVVVVAHRLSTVKNVDQVVYLEGGRVCGVGSFTQLKDTNEKFARLVELGNLE